MNKIKNIFADAIFYLVCILIACVLNIAVGWLMSRITTGVISDTFFASAISSIISYLLTLGVVIGALSYHDAYKTISHPATERSIGMALAGVMHFLIAIVFSFHPFVSGGVRALAGIINDGKNFTSAERVNEIYLWQYAVAFFACVIFMIAVLNVCAYVGKNNRKRSRKHIEGYHETEDFDA